MAIKVRSSGQWVDVSFGGSGSAGGSTNTITASTIQAYQHFTTYGSTSLSASIVPSSTSKRILVMATIPVYMTKGAAVNFQSMNLDLRRNGTSISTKQTGFYIGQVISRQDYGTTVTMNYLDSPASTSAVTYEVFAQAVNATGNYYTSITLDFTNTINLPFTPSHITLMEVG